MSLALRPVAPFDLALGLSFLRGFRPMDQEQVFDGPTMTKSLTCAGGPVAFRARQKGDRERAVLDVDLFADEPLGAGRWRDVLARVRALLGTDEDLAPFYARAAEDPAMRPLVASLRGLHPVRFPSAFEAACWAVIFQRTRLATARGMKAALTTRAGHVLRVDGVEHRSFPCPEAVSDLGEDELARLLPGGRRAKAVAALARAFRGVDEAQLRVAPLDEVRAWLRAIHGVGPFTSSLVLYRALGRFDGVALVSPRLVAAAVRQYGKPMTAADVAAKAASYGEWGGHWMLYLWASTFVEIAPMSRAPRGEMVHGEAIVRSSP